MRNRKCYVRSESYGNEFREANFLFTKNIYLCKMQKQHIIFNIFFELLRKVTFKKQIFFSILPSHVFPHFLPINFVLSINYMEILHIIEGVCTRKNVYDINFTSLHVCVVTALYVEFVTDAISAETRSRKHGTR